MTTILKKLNFFSFSFFYDGLVFLARNTWWTGLLIFFVTTKIVNYSALSFHLTLGFDWIDVFIQDLNNWLNIGINQLWDAKANARILVPSDTSQQYSCIKIFKYKRFRVQSSLVCACEFKKKTREYWTRWQ